MKSDCRTEFVRVSGNAYTSEGLPFAEKVMHNNTTVPAGNLDQNRGHGVWVGKAPMTNDHTMLTMNSVRKIKSVLRLPMEERCVTSELTKIRGLPWNGTSETLQAPIVTHQDQGPSGHRRTHLTSKIVVRCGVSPITQAVWA